MSDQFPRWDYPAYDNLKLDLVRRAWGDESPNTLTYDVSGASSLAIQRAAEEIENVFFMRAPPHGSIAWTRGEMNKEGHADNYAYLFVKNPVRVPAFIIVEGVQYRLLSYGKSRRDQRTVGVDGVTALSVNLEKIWGPRRPERVYRDDAVRIQTHTVISTLPAPPRL